MTKRVQNSAVLLLALAALLGGALPTRAQLQPVVPKEKRGQADAERSGTHDAANIRTLFYNYGMVGGYPADPQNVDLSVFHSMEVPRGSGMNYSDGVTPFVLAKVRQTNGTDAFIMETGYRERQGVSPNFNRVMRFEPRPGFFQADPAINRGRSPALSNDPRTWPDEWPDRAADPDDPGWSGSWNGYFGKRPAADQESYTVMDDDYYDAWDYTPDSRDPTRRGLGLRIEVRGFQWANPQAQNVIFWHYDITNESTTDYDDNIIFGLYMDSGVGGSALSCDGVYESDDDNAFYDKSLGLNLVYTWDKLGHGRDLTSTCAPTGYLGYAYLETPGNPFDLVDNDNDGLIDERRDSGPGELIIGQQAIRQYLLGHPEKWNLARFEQVYGTLETRPAYRAGRWWTGDENLTWVQELHDVGADGVAATHDTGEGDGMPTSGEPNFDKTDLFESDQIGLTGFQMNRIVAGAGNPSTEVENVIFFDDKNHWPRRLFEKFTNTNPAARFDSAVFLNYNIGFLFASGPFKLKAGKTERFSLALTYGADLHELRSTVRTVQRIYDANYQFAVPPPLPTVKSEAGDGFVRLTWDDAAERGIDPLTNKDDFEGYRIYRSTDPDFRDPKVIIDGRGNGPMGNGKPIAQFDRIDDKRDYAPVVVNGVGYYLGNETGLTHTWTDTTAVNGQQYYYAVCAYDFGDDSLGFYPSENAIAVSRTTRGGIVLPSNVVSVRPNPRTPGFVAATASAATHAVGGGVGSVDVRVVNSGLVPDGHLFALSFVTESPDSIRASSYVVRDSTLQTRIISGGYDLDGLGIGQTGSGVLPVVATPATVAWSPTTSGFAAGSPTNTRIKVSYQPLAPINLRRPGYPVPMTITFSDTPLDTSLPAIGIPARPVKFRIIAHDPTGEMRMKFRLRDPDADGTLSAAGEYIDIMTYRNDAPTVPVVTWRVELDTAGQTARGAIVPPRAGDVYELKLDMPFTPADVFTFRTVGEKIDDERAKTEFQEKPYVVPNPYVGAASFEPERFAVSGRGDRRLEFRGIPRGAAIRIFTVRGDLVQTLHHDGGNAGIVAWDLRTKDNLDVAPGLFIFHVDAGAAGTHIGKFAVIK
jgi:hypothetical protein